MILTVLLMFGVTTFVGVYVILRRMPNIGTWMLFAFMLAAMWNVVT